MMNLARTQSGTMIHDRNCRHARNGRPWLWANDKSAFDVWRIARVFQYRTCKICKPLGA